MFSLRFTIVALLALTISGQQYEDTKPSNNAEKGYPFGKLRLSEDGKKEELVLVHPVEQTQIKQDQKQNVQPLPSPCIGTRPLTRLPHPGDKTKYIYCRDEFHYEIFSCPNNGEYNYQIGSCEATVPVLDRCAEEKPCLNDGQCSVLSNSTFKCTCRSDWTGERCETPLNSCVKKPCGPNAECRILKTKDYEQDYVCVCHSKKGYGLNCDETVPNPCLKSTEQFFPFAYSQHAYLQCDGEIVYFQPCGPVLYWNQEEKVCDRKKPAKLDLSTLLKTYGVTEEDLEPSTTTTTTIMTTTTSKPLQEEQRGKQYEENIPFIPARIADRQQGLYSQAGQNRPWSQPQQKQQFGSQQWLNQVPASNVQNEQRFIPQSQSYQNIRVAPITTTTTPASINIPSWQNQQFQDQNQESDVETTTSTTTFIPSTTTLPSWLQNRPMNQWNGYQVPQSQSWQNFRIVTTTTTPAPVNIPSWQNQHPFEDQNQESIDETTTTTTLIPSTTTLPSWLQNRQMNQWNGYQVPQSWQNFRVVTTTTTPSTMDVPSWQNQQPLQDQNQESNDETTTTLIPSTTTLPSWLQNRQMNQWNGYQVPQSWQNFRVVTTTTTPSTMDVPSWQNQQSLQDQNQESNDEATMTTTLIPSTTTLPSWLQNRPMNQWNGYQVPQSQSWQNFRVVSTQQPIFQTTTTVPTAVSTPVSQDQVPSENQYQQSSWETTTVVPSSIQTQEQSWQVKPTNQWNSNHIMSTIGFQPQQSNNNPSSSQSRLNAQTVSTLQPILPITTTPQPAVLSASQNQWNTNQFSQPIGLTQQHGVAPIQKSLDQAPSWSTNQQFQSQWSQPSAAASNSRYQNLVAPAKSWPQSGNLEKQSDQPKTLESGSWNYRS